MDSDEDTRHLDGNTQELELGQEQQRMHHVHHVHHAFDMDDLSDESENDEVVDDDDTLASLLSSQNISTSALSNTATLPVSTFPTSIWPTQDPHSIRILGDTNTPAPTTVSQPQTWELDASSLMPHDAVLPYTEHSTATPLAIMDVEGRREEEERQNRLHDAGSSSTKHHEEVPTRQEGEPPIIDTARLMVLMQALQRYKPTESSSREPSTIPSLALSSSSAESASRARQEDGQSEEGRKDDRTDEDESEHSSADSGSEDESTLMPYICPEENVQLTSAVREQSTKALSVNRMFQQFLKKQMEEVEKARARNKQFRDQLQDLMDRQEAAKRAPVILPTTKARLGPPYFVDEDFETPPNNEDTTKREMRPIDITGKMRKWTQREREQLKAGVVSENKRLLFDAFLAAKDMAGIQSLSKRSDIQMMLNTKGLDWTRISQRFVDTRTPTECFIQWTGKDHPGINKSEWSSEELTKLDELAKKYKERNWVQAALDLDTNRTAAQCFRKYNSKAGKRVSKESWTKEEDNALIEAVRLMGERNWQQISYCFENRTAAQCSYRWTKSLNPAIRRGNWLEEEDGALRAALEVYGEGRWMKVQQHVLGRTDVQCRERYVNVLSPHVKSGTWSPEENAKLMELVVIHGVKNWSLISSLMDGRTDNQCARHYKSAVKVEGRQKRRQTEDEEYQMFLTAKESGTLLTTDLEIMDRRRHRAAARRMALQKAREAKESEERLEQEFKIKMEAEQLRLGNLHDTELQELAEKQEMELREDYRDHAKRERYFYDRWIQNWGKYVDPVEKGFNLGIPPETEQSPKSRNESKRAIPAPIPDGPDPASVLRPGRVRPVPPCIATMNAFSRHIAQGEHADGRFRLKNVIDNGGVVVNPLTTLPLSSQEQERPEYKELAERFESAFMWPMMMGMLHMEHARELVKPAPMKRKRRGRPPSSYAATAPARGSSDISSNNIHGGPPSASSAEGGTSQDGQGLESTEDGPEMGQHGQGQLQRQGSLSPSSSSDLDDPPETDRGESSDDTDSEEDAGHTRRTPKRARVPSTS
ncbi:hypothetical protein EDD21DRAFT_366344 [Dissophora ornata]|nr:Myb-like DNA-binding domain protein [Dissophora ornata]KAI8604392.1 hypothetical protein EDD21DRAFT_366344 [Dissophora ornata]